MLRRHLSSFPVSKGNEVQKQNLNKIILIKTSKEAKQEMQEKKEINREKLISWAFLEQTLDKKERKIGNEQ